MSDGFGGGALSRRDLLAGGSALMLAACGKTERSAASATRRLPHADIAWMDALQLVARFRARTLSPVDCATMLLDRIEASQDSINAFGHLDRKATLAAAAAAEKRWRAGTPLSALDGVPVSVKDASDLAVEGWPVTYGTAALDPVRSRADADAPLIARMRRAGLVLSGITTAPDVYQCVCSTSSRTGVTRNPWNSALSAGGSSAGAGAAAAAGLGPLHMGTDGGGSVRTPAAWCGVFGIIPGVRFTGYPIGLPGIIARTVTDAAHLAAIVGGVESAEGWRWPATDYPAGLQASSLRGQRLAVWPDPSPVGVWTSDEVARIVDVAIGKVAAEAGSAAAVLPMLLDREALISGWTAGIAETLLSTDRLLPPERRHLADPWLLTQIERARAIPPDLLGPMADRYQPMIDAVAADPRLAALDIVMSATMPVQPYPAELHFPADYDDSVIPYGLDDGGRLLGQTSMFSLLGWASASIPCGFDGNGMPVGLMIGVRPGPDDMLRCLQAARWIEAIVAPTGRYPPI
jgi:aspartyl-tRNA(Asn)/glutamyl-tRNA(Gln) amidotransferase subunit A